jgi:cation diffusion facilitator family transporter
LISTVRIQRNITFLALFLFIIKLIAWWWTKSVSIFTDAMESTVNVASGLIGWYSLWLAAKPRDRNHPYGHGKAEFVSAAIEGTLIAIAGIIIIFEAVRHIKDQQQIQQLDFGILLIAATAVINYIAGTFAIRKGRQVRSVALEASGQHLRSDTYSTIGIVLGLFIIKFTGWIWLDATVAIIFAIVILVTGYKVLRRSMAGIMDEANLELLEKMIVFINLRRQPQWIDMHNLRMIQYGTVLHLDGHLTLPWYLNVHEAHREIDALDKLIRDEFGDAIELFVHVDGCLDFSCRICTLDSCPVRKHDLVEKQEWTVDNVLNNQKHGLHLTNNYQR